MRNTFYLLIFALLVIFSSCCNQDDKKSHEEKHETAVAPASSTGNFGEVITDDAAIPVAILPELLEGKESVNVKLTGDVAAVCQMSGCWMDLHLPNDEIIHVTFKDDGFLLPKDAAGKTAVIEGVATYDEIPVEMLKRIAEDEGKTQDEIDAITESKLEYTFIAKGVILY
jgi:hypothetical protein